VLFLAAVLAAGRFWPRENPDLAVYRKVAPAVVLVETSQDHGTGFLVSGDGWLVTNYHVVRDATPDPETGALRATVYLGKLVDDHMTRIEEPVPAFLYKHDAVKDLALLKLTKKPDELAALPHLGLAGARTKIEAGLPCWVVGHPVAGTVWLPRSGHVDQVADWPRDTPDVVVAHLTASPAERAALEAQLEQLRTKVILSQCDLGKGDSGSPLVDQDGDVIGVSFAVPSAKGGGGAPRFGFHVHRDVLADFLADCDRLGPAPPLYVPALRPRDSSYRPADLANNGQLDAVIFSRPDENGPGPVTGLWLDLLHVNRGVVPEDFKDPKKDPVANGRWRFQLALLFEPFPVACYDTDGDGTIDLIVEDSDGDGKADLVLRRAGESWVLGEGKGRPLLDAGWFAESRPELGKRLAGYQGKLGKDSLEDVLRSLGT
jgi:serine protease Do